MILLQGKGHFYAVKQVIHLLDRNFARETPLEWKKSYDFVLHLSIT